MLREGGVGVLHIKWTEVLVAPVIFFPLNVLKGTARAFAVWTYEAEHPKKPGFHPLKVQRATQSFLCGSSSPPGRGGGGGICYFQNLILKNKTLR